MKARALTLIELVAALAVLGVLLAGVLTAKSRLQTQWVSAEATLAAVDGADALLEGWLSAHELPINASGDVPGEAGLVWETRALEDEAAERLLAEVVRVSIYRADDRDEAGERRAILSVDVLAPLPGVDAELTEEEAEAESPTSPSETAGRRD